MLRLMNFTKYGRTYQLKMGTAQDLEYALKLDEAHWVATGAPIESLNCDLAFLKYVDTDMNNRIMCFELKDAISWLMGNLKDLSGVTEGRFNLSLDAINMDTEEGARIRQSAEKMLVKHGQASADEITLAQVRKIKSEEEQKPVSEAGVVLPEAAEDPEVKAFIDDIITTVGGTEHPSGKRGVNQAELDEFIQACRDYLAWHEKGVLPEGDDETGQKKSDILPFGTDTAAAYGTLSSIRDKFDQYFAQCEAVSLDGRVAGLVALSDEAIKELDFGDRSVISGMMQNAPLAAPRADCTLDFSLRLNPFYEKTISLLWKQVIEPVLKRPAGQLSMPDWDKVKGTFADYETWLNSKAGALVEPLGLEKINEYLGDKYSQSLKDLMAQSSAMAFVMDNIRLVEKLVLYQGCLFELANNFVSFPFLYDPEKRALFEFGTLIMDSRRFNLAVKVPDRKRHSKISGTSNMYVLYLELRTRGKAKKCEIAVPVTSGGKGNLCVGKRGVFKDIDGEEWDAEVVQIIENPISLNEAIVSPFKRLGRFITEKIESMTSVAEKKLEKAAGKAVTDVKTSIETPVQKAAAQSAKAAGGGLTGSAAGGILMNGSIAVAALGSAGAFMTKTMANLGLVQVLSVLIGGIIAVMLPATIVALIKLRRRDLSAVLEASGWAINARMRLTRGQSYFFTRYPDYPLLARGVPRRKWWLIILVTVLVLFTLSAGGYYGHKYYLKCKQAAVEKISETKQQVKEAVQGEAVQAEPAATDKTGDTRSPVSGN